jgi:polyvinyl alcohol dehydrogenase (cytochrome)
MMRRAIVFAGLVLAAAPVFAQAPNGQAVYDKSCAMCHQQPAADSRAPNRDGLAQFSPESIVTALTSGNMYRQGYDLNDAEKKAVAEFLAGRPMGSPTPIAASARCTAPAPPMADPTRGTSWNGWGGTVTNTRYVPADKGGITAPLVPRLKLKWAFGLPGVTAARSQPVVVGGRLFISSESGDVFALNAKTGCIYWVYHAKSGIRAAVSIGQYKTSSGATAWGAYFTDGAANAYGVDATTGKEIWVTHVDDHPLARATGSPTYYNGKVYVPLAGVTKKRRARARRTSAARSVAA